MGYLMDKRMIGRIIDTNEVDIKDRDGFLDKIENVLELIKLCADDSYLCEIKSAVFDKDKKEFFLEFIVSDFAIYRSNETSSITNLIDDMYFVRHEDDEMNVRIGVKYE